MHLDRHPSPQLSLQWKDSILPAPLREPQYNVIGGVKPSYTFLIENDSFFEQAGTYAMIGARFFRKPPSTKLVGSVIHLGSDFTDRLHKEILSWETNSLFIPTPDRPTTRATNLYFAAGHRGRYIKLDKNSRLMRLGKVFEYVTEKIQIEPTLLDREQLFSKTFHLICSPTRCIEIVNGLLDARDKAIVPELQAKNTTKMRPIFVWEPVPDSCKPSELENLLEALKHVDVVSPNHLELQSLFGETPDGDLPIDDSILRRRCNVLLAKGFGAKPSAVVVRLGERGCYVAQMIRHIFLPAYHRPRSDLNETEKSAWTEKVADPTGGGNAFLGGYCIGLLTAPCPLGLTEFEMAAVYGSVAASFVIEQFGMPKLSIRESDGQELWNGESAHDRMNMYERRLDVPKLTEQQLERASLYADANEPPSVLDIDNEQGIPIKKMVRKSGLQTKKQSPPVEG